ncbi:MAG TPA: XdhC family protein [Planctomycetota bacterium]|nr:XdhC family protein [Planctomycetota bacterium]HRR82293.1 XdhC family protein [Planctomycetota bacterium]HRT95065.1 XdhC family protein [Planctomycetota bacterium]
MNVSHPAGDIHQAIVELADRGQRFAVAVVLEAEGSSPVGVGAKAAIAAGGVLRGTVGGGAVEAEAQRRAAEAIATGRPLMFRFTLFGRAVGDASPICGGRMRLLVDPTAARHRDAYAAAAAARRCRQRGALVTHLRGAEPCEVAVEFLRADAVPPEQDLPGAEAVRTVLEAEQPALFAEEGREALVEPLIPRPVLVIVGGGHVGQAVAAQADLVGFEVVVMDDRPEFTRPELFPAGAATCCGPVAERLADFPFAGDTYVVIVTRGHQHDAEALAACLRRPAAYVGMIGSRRKVALMRDDFIQSGRATPEEFARVYAPIGLDIGAATVPEIAASIVAQLIAVRRTGRAPRMPLH